MTEPSIDEQVGLSCPAEVSGREGILPGAPLPEILSITPQLARLIDPDIDADVKLIYAELVREFPQITHVYGGSNSPDHNNKRCLDLMVVDLDGRYIKARGMTNLSWSGQRALGDRIVAYLKLNAVRLGVNGLIWNHAGDDAKVMGFPHSGGQNTYRGPVGVWRDYWSPKSHSDHVHVEVDASPYIPPPVDGARPLPTSGEVYVDKIVAGQTDSDSVAYVELALAKVLGMVLPVTGTYGPTVVAAATEYQRRLGDTLVDGLLGPLQLVLLMKQAGMAVKVYRSSVTGGLVTDPEPEPPPVPPVPTDPSGHTVKVGTANLLATNSLSNMRRALAAFSAAGADVLGVQELSVDSKQKGLTSYAKSIGWAATSRNTAVTTFYRKSTTELVRESFVLVQQAGRRWESGAGGNDTILKIIMITRFRDKRSGRTFTVLNNHLVPSVDLGGRFDKRKPIRVGVWRKQMTALAKQFTSNRSAGMVAATGDFNVGWNHPTGDEVQKRMDAVDATVCWDEFPDQPTHTSHRTIDFVVSTGLFLKLALINVPGSDHEGVLCSIDLDKKGS